MSEKKSFSRRNFIKSTTALTALAGVGSVPFGLAGCKATGGPRKIIMLISDGMSMGLLPMADRVQQLRNGGSTHWAQLMRLPSSKGYSGWMDMTSATGAVTDSAAAASSWSIGERIENGTLNVTPDGRSPLPILHRVKEAGLQTAIVTTAFVNHATPAGFLVNSADRNAYEAIAVDYLQRGADIMLGGGMRFFAADQRGDKRDLWREFGDAGYQTVRNTAELKSSAAGKRLLGVFFDDHLPYEIDRANDVALRQAVPDLAEMTRQALRHLDHEGGGFFMQVEGARIDHAAHANDSPGAIFDQLAFDDAVGVALAYREVHPETVIIVTTDHGNANPGWNGHGKNYSNSDEFNRLADARSSYQSLYNSLNKGMADEAIRNRVREATGIELEPRDVQNLRGVLEGERTGLYRHHRGVMHLFSAIMANYTTVNWTSGVHTADYSPLTILGADYAELPQFLKNTDLHQFLVGLFS